MVQSQIGNFTVARQLLTKTRHSLEDQYGSDHPQYLKLTSLLADVEVGEGGTRNVYTALELLQQVVEVSIKKGFEQQPQMAGTHQQMANCFHRLGRLEAAVASLQTALSISSAHYGSWSVQAQSLMQHIEIVEGELRTREWTAQSGTQRCGKVLHAEVRAMREPPNESSQLIPTGVSPRAEGRSLLGRRQHAYFGDELVHCRRGQFPGVPPEHDPVPLYGSAKLEEVVSDKRAEPLPDDNAEPEVKGASSISLEPMLSLLPQATQERLEQLCFAWTC